MTPGRRPRSAVLMFRSFECPASPSPNPRFKQIPRIIIKCEPFPQGLDILHNDASYALSELLGA